MLERAGVHFAIRSPMQPLVSPWCFSGVDLARELPHNWGVMANAEPRITVNPRQCGGRPCVRGMRIRVTGVLDLLAAGLSTDEVLAELPDLEREDILACLRYARQRLDHPVLAA